MNIILLGAPGAGKGTQAEVISNHLGIPSVSTGGIIREAVEKGTEFGKEVKDYIDKGFLVPDELVVGLVKERIAKDDCKNGFILDGFPRTIPQAEALETMGVPIDKVIDIFVEPETIVTRLSGRRVCSKCGNSYHLTYKKPLKDGVCDTCGGTLIQRKDDDPDIIRERLVVYNNQTQPLVDFYREKGKLFVVKGQEKVEDTSKLTLEALED